MVNPAIKRLTREFKQLREEPSPEFHAEPLGNNLFEWHFTLKGPTDTCYEGGTYHGRIILPTEYPCKPPSIVFLTPNGRFPPGTMICLSITKHHPEFWQPAWGIRTAILAISSLFPIDEPGALGAIQISAAERKKLAVNSRKFCCGTCKRTNEQILHLEPLVMQNRPEAHPSTSGFPYYILPILFFGLFFLYNLIFGK